MRKHRRGPKHQYVRKYARWVEGKRKRVGNHKRGADPKPPNKRCEWQMDFGF